MSENEKPVILLVDDEPDLLEILAMELEYSGFDIVPASNGRDAYAKLDDNPVSIILSDIRMADGDGIELLDRVISRGANPPPLIFMTGFADITEEEAYARGASGFFHKPVDSGVLVNGINRALLPPGEIWRQESEENCSHSIELTVEDGAESRFTPGRGGFFIGVESAAQKPGTRINFRIRMGGAQLEGQGVVRWNRKKNNHGLPVGSGVEIERMTPESIELYLGMVAKEKPVAYIPMN